MLPQTQPRKPRNSQRINLLISFSFHAAIVAALVFFAAREGLLGKQLRKIAVEMVKEKPPEKANEPEKPKVEPPKIEPPKIDPPKLAVTTPTAVPQAAPAASPESGIAAPPPVAPPATEVPSFVFEGGKAVETSSDPAQIYKGFVEWSLRSNWARPEGVEDKDFIAEVELSIDRAGRLTNPDWKKNSGHEGWDASVRRALAATPSLRRPPPDKFPARVLVRFDVQEVTEPALQ